MSNNLVLPTNWLPNHAPTAAEAAALLARADQAHVVVAGVRITNAGNPIATTSGTTELDLAKYAMTNLTLITGRYYLARYLVTRVKTVGGDTFDFRLRANTPVSGTQIGRLDSFAQDPTTQTAELGFLFVGDASYTSIYLSAVRTAGTGTLAYYGTSGGFNRSWATLSDLGPASVWTDAA